MDRQTDKRHTVKLESVRSVSSLTCRISAVLPADLPLTHGSRYGSDVPSVVKVWAELAAQNQPRESF